MHWIPAIVSMMGSRGWAAARFLRAAAVLALLLGPAAATAADGVRFLDEAVYARSQAREGKALYEEHCVTCHARGYFREVLRVREGETLSQLYDVMVALMPQNAPGTLSDEQYIDVIAYIVSEGRYRPGKRPLRYADLQAIVIGQKDSAE